MDTKRSSVLWIVAVAVLLLAVGGGVYLTRRQGTKPAPAPQPEAKQEPFFPDRPGVQFASYPDDFPRDLAVFPAFFEQSLRTTGTDGRELISVVFNVGTDPDSVRNAFQTMLKFNGWTLSDTKTKDGRTILHASKDADEADIGLQKASATSTKVSLVYYKPKQ